MSDFSQTQSLQAYAVSNGITGLELISNPNTGKTFAKFSNGTTARLSEKVTSLDGDLSISWFAPEGGEASWMIHPTGKSNVIASMTFGVTAPVASIEQGV